VTNKQAVFVAIPIVLLVIQAILNVAFTLTFFYQINDFQFNEHR
jgi:hypothetical protein